MSKCENCIHYERCDHYHIATDEGPYAYQNIDLSNRDDVEEICDDFKSKSLFVELPCAVGDVVYSIQETYSKCKLGTYYDEISCDGCECECDSEVSYGIQEEIVSEISYNGRFYKVRTNKSCCNFVDINVSKYGVFLTEEQAKAKLKEMG